MHKSKVREHIGNLSNKELWDIFDEMELFEKTGAVGPADQLRLIATKYMDDNALAMMVVAHEVWRELAQRGAAYTM